MSPWNLFAFSLLSFPAHRSADPFVSQMLFGSWSAAISVRSPWRPYSNWGRTGRTGPEVCQPNASQSAGVWPLLHGDPKNPHPPTPGTGNRSAVCLIAPAAVPGTLDPGEKLSIFLGQHHQWPTKQQAFLLSCSQHQSCSDHSCKRRLVQTHINFTNKLLNCKQTTVLVLQLWPSPVPSAPN